MGHIMFDPFITIPEIEEELHYLGQLTWPVTKGVCTQLFTADGTRITERIGREVGFVRRDGGNNVYQIVDPKARGFYESLKLWAKHNSQLYDMVIDPISAPKKLPARGYAEFHEQYLKLRQLDLVVSGRILSEIKGGSMDANKTSISAIQEFDSELQQLQQKTVLLYQKYNLPMPVTENRHIY